MSSLNSKNTEMKTADAAPAITSTADLNDGVYKATYFDFYQVEAVEGEEGHGPVVFGAFRSSVFSFVNIMKRMPGSHDDLAGFDSSIRRRERDYSPEAARKAAGAEE